MCAISPKTKVQTAPTAESETDHILSADDSENPLQARLIPLQRRPPWIADISTPLPTTPHHSSEDRHIAQSGQASDKITDLHDSDWGPCPSGPPSREHWYFDRDMEEEIKTATDEEFVVHDSEVDQFRKRDRLKRKTLQLGQIVNEQLNDEARREEEEREFRL